MGCLTGFVAKIILTLFNGLVAAGAGAIIIVSSITASQLAAFEDWVPKQTTHLTTALQSTGSFVLFLGVLGIVTVCCCHNKLFLGVYSVIGLCLVAAVLTSSGIGLSSLEDNNNATLDALMESYDNYTAGNLDGDGTLALNTRFYEAQCCGVSGPEDFTTKIPSGCCDTFNGIMDGAPACKKPEAFEQGCAAAIDEVFQTLAMATFQLGIVFGVALLALLLTTYVLIKCTDALPI